jgi:AAA domain
MTMQIISFEERLAERHGVRALIVGEFGIGKTSLLRTIDPSTATFVDIENGSLAVHDVPVPHIRPQTWPEIRDVAVKIAGPNRSFGPNENYSQAHFDRVGGYLPGIEQRPTVFFDTITAAGQLCFRWASAQPESFTERGKPDLRSAYGLHAREFLLMLRHLQSARGSNVFLIGAMERVTDDYGRVTHQLQMEGQRIGREIGGIVDIVITMQAINFSGDDKPTRAFVCTSPNPWGYPAKDRSGKLEQIEKPDLGALIAKILPSRGEPLEG